jgi:hypothetical protein
VALTTVHCGYLTGTNALLTNLPFSFAPPFFGGGARGFSFGEKFRQNEKEIKITREYYFAISPFILKAIANFGKKKSLEICPPTFGL